MAQNDIDWHAMEWIAVHWIPLLSIPMEWYGYHSIGYHSIHCRRAAAVADAVTECHVRSREAYVRAIRRLWRFYGRRRGGERV